MRIGDDQAARVDDHAGAERVLNVLAGAAELMTEEFAEERIVEHRRPDDLRGRADVDIDHGGGCDAHDRRE